MASIPADFGIFKSFFTELEPNRAFTSLAAPAAITAFLVRVLKLPFDSTGSLI